MIIYRAEVAIIVDIDEANGKLNDIYPLKIEVDIDKFRIRQIFPCIKDTACAVFIQTNDKDRPSGTGMLIVWDTEKNTEIKNFTINNCDYFTFGNGHDSELGYVFIKSNDW